MGTSDYYAFCESQRFQMDSAAPEDLAYKNIRLIRPGRVQMIGDEQVGRLRMPMAASISSHFAEGEGLTAKIYFEVPFEQKEAAKAAGLRWDNANRKWYAANAEIATAFSRATEVDGAPAQAERVYFKVPFLQKDRAKAMGMRFDGIRKLWFATNQVMAVDAARPGQLREPLPRAEINQLPSANCTSTAEIPRPSFKSGFVFIFYNTANWRSFVK